MMNLVSYLDLMLDLYKLTDINGLLLVEDTFVK